jgi:hypothetical protein
LCPAFISILQTTAFQKFLRLQFSNNFWYLSLELRVQTIATPLTILWILHGLGNIMVSCVMFFFPLLTSFRLNNFPKWFIFPYLQITFSRNRIIWLSKLV